MAKYKYISKLSEKFRKPIRCSYDYNAQYKALMLKDYLEIVNFEESDDICEFLLSDLFDEIIEFVRRRQDFELKVDDYICDVTSNPIYKRFRIYTIYYEPIIMLIDRLKRLKQNIDHFYESYK